MSELVFTDSGVLIAAGRGPVAEAAKGVLLNSEFDFASTPFVWLEVLAKAKFTGRLNEVRFYQTYFDSVSAWADVDAELLEAAAELASRHRLSAIDALHAAATVALNATRLVTTERAGRPLHRVCEVAVETIHSGLD